MAEVDRLGVCHFWLGLREQVAQHLIIDRAGSADRHDTWFTVCAHPMALPARSARAWFRFPIWMCAICWRSAASRWMRDRQGVGYVVRPQKAEGPAQVDLRACRTNATEPSALHLNAGQFSKAPKTALSTNRKTHWKMQWDTEPKFELLLDVDFSDVEHMCESVKSWNLDFRPLRLLHNNNGAGRIIQARSGPVEYSYARIHQSIEQFGDPPRPPCSRSLSLENLSINCGGAAMKHRAKRSWSFMLAASSTACRGRISRSTHFRSAKS